MPLVDQHPPGEELKDFALGRLDDALFDAVESHVAECSACEKIVSGISGDTFTSLLQAARAQLETPPPVAGATFVEPFRRESGATCAWGTAGDEGSSDLPAALVNHPRYLPLRFLGHGGMGSVWLAEHRVMGRQVAVKAIRPEFIAKPGAAARFRREAHAAASLNHPNIVAAFDAEQAGDTQLLAMEYIEGVNLADELRRRGPLSIAEACDCVRQAAVGLQHAFSCGLIHRDLKPHNLMRTADGTVKILDFGLAVLADVGERDGGLTGQNVVLGTPDYIAPEQAEDSHAADVRSDIYSLGCTLYHLLTGRVPFPGESLLRKLDAHRTQEPESLRTIRPELPTELAMIVSKMMAKSQAERYQTPAEVAGALAPFAAGTIPVGTVPPRKKPRRRQRWYDIVLPVAAGILMVAFVVYRILTDNGTIEIRTDDENVKIIAERNGKQITVLDPKSKQTWRLDSGEWTLRLDGNPDGLKLEMPDKFTLKRGDKRIVRISRVEAVAEEKVGAVRSFEGHEGPVRAVAYSPDGRYVLSGSGYPNGDKTVRLWDVATGKEIRKFEGHTDQVFSVAYSPDGRYVLSGGGDRTIRLWDVATGKEIRQFQGHAGSILFLAFSPDGRYALSGGGEGDNTARLWDVETGKEVRKFEAGGWVMGVAFSPDGRRAFAAISTGAVRVWEVATGKQLRSYQGTANVMSPSVACSPNGHLVAFGDNGKVILWDAETGKVVRSFGSGAISVAFSPDGRRVLSNSNKVLELWDVETGQEIHRFAGHIDNICAVAFSPDGRYAISGSGGRDWTVRLWRLPDPPPPEKVGEVRRFKGHTDRITGIALSPDEPTAATTSKDNTVRIWDVKTGKQTRLIDGHTGLVSTPLFTPDGKRLVTSSDDKTVRLWDLATGKELWRTDFEGGVRGLCLTPDGRSVLAACRDNNAYLLDLESGKKVSTFEGHTGGVHAVAASADGKWLLTGGDDNTLRIWDRRTGKAVHLCEGHDKLVHWVAFSRDSLTALSAGFDGTVRLWDVLTGKEIQVLRGHSGQVQWASFTPDGRRVVSLGYGPDGTLRVWERATGKEVFRYEGLLWGYGGGALFKEGMVLAAAQDDMVLLRLPDPPPPEKVGQVHLFEGHKDIVHGIAVSRDGHYAVSGGGYKFRDGHYVLGANDYDIRLWDLGTRTELRRLSGSEAPVWSVALSPDGGNVLSSGGNPTGAIRLLDAATGRELKHSEGREHAVWSVAFSPDGRQSLDAADFEKDFRLWDLDSGKEVRRFNGHTKPVRRAIFSPDGRRALSASYDGTARLWDMETGNEMKRFGSGQLWVNTVAFSPDGRRVMTGGNDRMVRLWDVESGNEVKRFEGHKALVNSVAFSPDGRFALSAGGGPAAEDKEDFSLRLWDLESGKELHRFEGHKDVVSQVIWLPDGRHALSCSWDTTVRLWRLPEPSNR